MGIFRSAVRIKAALAGASALAFTALGPALANDSTAELAAGGLVLTKTTAIEMRSEDLFISAKAVRVKYQFLNTSTKDVTTTVAFPMPDITTNGFDDMLSIPTDNPVNILDFHTLVDGKPVKAQAEQKAISPKHVDQTAYLKSLGLPLAPHLATTNTALDQAPKAVQQELLKRGLAVANDYDAGKGMEHHLAATWTLKTTFFWSQNFPAGKILLVEHSYKPSVGESAGTSWGVKVTPDAEQAAYQAKERARFCVDDALLATLKRTIKKDEVMPPFNEQRIDYILTSGANWKAPIGDFHMVIDKGAPANLVSFCGEDVKKIGPTTFEVHHTNFTPKREVAVLVLLPLPPSP